MEADLINHSTVPLICVFVNGMRMTDLQGAANKSNPLPCFVNISTINRNFY